MSKNVIPKLIVAGVLALDDLKTPYESGKRVAGGAGIYSSVASSIFSRTALVAAIGYDFPVALLNKIEAKGIDIQSVTKLEYPTFHWSGEYKGDMAQAITHDTNFEINGHYDWKIAKEHREVKTLLLCNNDPNIQEKVLRQMDAEIVAMDTMNLWIDTEREILDDVVSKVDILFINDAEAQLYSNYENLDEASKKLLRMGPKYVIIKKGEQGASLYTKNSVSHLPAFVVKEFVDPTGAGDSFAGATMGYLANLEILDKENLIVAMNYGAAVASITVEGFGTTGIMNLSKPEVEERFQKLSGGPGRI
ncbi:MAG: PfkB family carbohydrate kinase [Candidatus Thermoplasmatota archaeon]|nr:PfkB family carbohydrate kinase [Candidatus Thermoplasmatota archaeon]